MHIVCIQSVLKIVMCYELPALPVLMLNKAIEESECNHSNRSGIKSSPIYLGLSSFISRMETVTVSRG